MIITITGATGSGKTTISNYLKTLNENIIVIDIDKLAHQVIESNKEEIENKLNIKYKNRKELSNIVFNNKELLIKLENITKEYIENKIDNIIKKNINKIIILDYALIQKSKYYKESIKILIKADDEIRKSRIIKRDNLTNEEYNNINNNKQEYNENEFNYIIINNINYKKNVNKIYKKLIKCYNNKGG